MTVLGPEWQIKRPTVTFGHDVLCLFKRRHQSIGTWDRVIVPSHVQAPTGAIQTLHRAVLLTHVA